MPIVGANMGHSGIASCDEGFGDSYCIRKIIELITSAIIMIAALITFINIVRKQKHRQYLWLALLVVIIFLCLLVNIIFCFFNTDYWLYAVETYCYNLYYLFLVGYVTKSCLLKYRQIINFKKFLLDPENQKRKGKQRTIFFSIFIGIAIMYTLILIASITLEVLQKKNDQVERCQEIWYLCFEGGCLLLSFIVLLTLYKNQVEETQKIEEYQKQFQKRQNARYDGQIQKGEDSSVEAKINNPLKSLWIWITFNVISQLFNMIESVLFQLATPPKCLIVNDDYLGSNLLQLFFVFTSMYLCFSATIFYIANRSANWNKYMVDRQLILQLESDRAPNIELFPPSNKPTISNSPE